MTDTKKPLVFTVKAPPRQECSNCAHFNPDEIGDMGLCKKFDDRMNESYYCFEWVKMQ